MQILADKNLWTLCYKLYYILWYSQELMSAEDFITQTVVKHLRILTFYQISELTFLVHSVGYGESIS